MPDAKAWTGTACFDRLPAPKLNPASLSASDTAEAFPAVFEEVDGSFRAPATAKTDDADAAPPPVALLRDSFACLESLDIVVLSLNFITEILWWWRSRSKKIDRLGWSHVPG